MADRVVLHVGAMKSGTSYLQSRLFASKEQLAAQGVCVPGRTWNDQVTGVLDVLGRRPDGGAGGGWSALLDEVGAEPGTAVVSMEFLGPVSPEKIDTVVASLRPARVSVVLTARDLNRSLAAMWQETVQNGRWWTWHDYLDGAQRARPRPARRPEDVTEAGRTFWRQQNTVRLARQWSAAEGVDDFTLVTLPPPDGPADVLAERFATVVGFDAATLQPGPRANTSVDAAAAEVLRRTNGLLAAQGLEFPRGAVLRKRRLAKSVLASRVRPDLRIGLPVAPWVAEHAVAMVTALQDLGVDHVGEWSDLDPVAVPGIDPAGVSDADVLEAAEQGLEGLEPDLRERLGADWAERAVAPPVRGGGPTSEAADTTIARLAAGLAAAIRAEED
jgi:hypothetical protein